MQNCRLQELGLIEYNAAWQIQKEIFNTAIQYKLENKELPDAKHTLLICEHPHVYTMGKSAEMKNLLLNETELAERNITSYHIERGGDITYHGPGQLVVYPIFDIEALKIGVKEFVFRVEECIINTLRFYAIESERIDGRIGIWIGKGSSNERKIAAIGIKCSRFITMHGLALNVNTDLNLFNHIIPCGIADKSVTSLQNEIGRSIDIIDVKNRLINEFSTTFDVKFI
ncbi:MAG: lipoyl(octanoyl) transferase LipB [bacterium]|nr:lipoyl(octanoyl) transferase LipB [bacterium]